MLKIGTFSKLSRLSIRMLRRYDELGLLQPVHTDPFTGYRYYREEQLTTAGRIAALRDMGFGLSAIGALLEDGGRRTGGAGPPPGGAAAGAGGPPGGDEAAAAPPGHGPCTVEKG